MCRRYVPHLIVLTTAPQKIAYMADSYWRTLNTPLPSRSFITGMPTMFSVPHYSKALDAIRQEKGIGAEFNTNLVAIDAARKVATFEVLAGENKGKKVEKEYGLLHVVPPMGPLDWIKKSPLADAAGWVDVNAGTLQSTKYENVFSLGDASSLPTSKVSFSISWPDGQGGRDMGAACGDCTVGNVFLVAEAGGGRDTCRRYGSRRRTQRHWPPLGAELMTRRPPPSPPKPPSSPPTSYP